MRDHRTGWLARLRLALHGIVGVSQRAWRAGMRKLKEWWTVLWSALHRLALVSQRAWRAGMRKLKEWWTVLRSALHRLALVSRLVCRTLVRKLKELCTCAMLCAAVATIIAISVTAWMSNGNEWIDRLKGGWCTTGERIAFLAFSTLLLATFIKQVFERFSQKTETILKDTIEKIELETREENIKNLFVEAMIKTSNEKSKVAGKEAEDMQKVKLSKAEGMCRRECGVGAVYALLVMLSDIGRGLGPFSVCLMWPLFMFWWRCHKVVRGAEEMADNILLEFREAVEDAWKNCENENNQVRDTFMNTNHHGT